MKFPKGTGKYYFDYYYNMYPVKHVDNRVDMEQMKKDEEDFISKVRSGEIKFDIDGNFIGTLKTKG